MNRDRQQHRTQLFTLQLWAEEVGPGQTVWRGKVQHVFSGQTRSFRDWDALVAHLQKMLSQIAEEPAGPRL